MSTIAAQNEKQNQRIGAITSAVMHILLILVLLFSFMEVPNPPPGQMGVLVNFGESPDVGQGEEEPAVSDVADLPSEEPNEPVEEPIEDPVEEPEVEPEKPQPEASKPDNSRKILEDQRAKELALKKKEEKEKAREAWLEKERVRKEKEAKERKEQAERDRIAEQKRKAEEAKRAEEARKKKELEDFKNKIGGGFTGGSQGNSGTPGNAGDPNGDPDGKALDGISTGTGDVGGGLSGRGLVSRPSISANTQNSGDVVVTVCVNSSGNVVSAKYTQRGSTTNNATLIREAIKAANKYKFDKSNMDKQCGTIKIKFRLR